MSPSARKKYYTQDEANAVLPHVRKIVAKIRRTEELREEKQKALTEILNAVAMNGGAIPDNYIHRLSLSVARQANQLRRNVEYLQQKFHCEVKGLHPLLVDFYSLRDGREVYLCWREGESDIAHWHDLDAGFAGRQPI